MVLTSRRIAALVMMAAAAGCGPQALPDPRVLSITPAQMLESDAVDVVVEVEAVMDFQVDYPASTASVDRTLVLSIGPQVVGNNRYETNGVLHAFVPSKLQAGTYDVSMMLPDQRSATLSQAFTVLPGLWPDGYLIDPIADQQRDVPFTITIRATGANAPGFRGTVDLDSSNGVMNPEVTGPFENGGVRVQTVVFTSAVGMTRIRLSDLHGRSAMSNNFRVR
jgi:hypothetical protein